MYNISLSKSLCPSLSLSIYIYIYIYIYVVSLQALSPFADTGVCEQKHSFSASLCPATHTVAKTAIQPPVRCFVS